MKRNEMKEAFIEFVGDNVNESSLDEDTWMSWLGIFASGWMAAEDYYVKDGQNMRNEMAALIHDIWRRWMEYLLLEKCYRGDDGGLVISPHLEKRWTRQMTTEYTSLPESEKESDLRLADEIISTIICSE